MSTALKNKVLKANNFQLLDPPPLVRLIFPYNAADNPYFF